MSDAIGARCEVTGHEYCYHVHWSVCSYIMCACVCAALALMVGLRAISFYSTMTARWRNTERHWVELLHMRGCKNPHFVPLFRRQMGKKAGLDLGHLLIDDVTWRVCL